MISKFAFDDIAERVARGAALLDSEIPGWWQLIDVDSLDINDCYACVIGQLFADEAMHWNPFEVGAAWLIGRDAYGCDTHAPALIDHGFSVSRSDDETEVNALTAEWKRLISERRASSN
jgi:hypothetical protein